MRSAPLVDRRNRRPQTDRSTALGSLAPVEEARHKRPSRVQEDYVPHSVSLAEVEVTGFDAQS